MNVQAVCIISSIFLYLITSSAESREQPSAVYLPKAELEKLISGEILVEVERMDNLNRAEMYGVVNQPIDKVWPIVQSNKDVTRKNPDIRRIDVLYSDGNGRKQLRGINKMPWPLDDRYWEVSTYSRHEQLNGDDYHISSWQYIKGSGNIVDLYGYWLLEPFGSNGENTLIKYVIYMDLGLWIPNIILNWATSRILPNIINNVRYRCEDDSFYDDDTLATIGTTNRNH